MAFVGFACPELDLSTAIQRKEGAVLAHGGAVKGSPDQTTRMCRIDDDVLETPRKLKMSF